MRAAAPLIRAAKFPFGYLRRLISHDRDWSTYTSAAVLREAEAAAAVEVKAKNNATQTAIEAALPPGKLLTNAAGKLVWLRLNGVVYACPVVDLVKPESLRSYARVIDLAKMAEAIQAGRLFEFSPSAPPRGLSLSPG